MQLYVFFGILIVFVLVFIGLSVKIVRQSEVLVIERLGKYYRTCNSGLNIIIPFLDRVAKRIDLKTQILDSPPQPVITKDNVTMSIDTVLFFQITDPFKASYELSNLVLGIRNLTTTTLRDVIGTMELDYTLSSREDINTRLRLFMDEATDKWGVRVERVEVKNIELPPDIRDAMEKQMRAEREKRALILTAEGQRQASITEAEGVKQATILRAEADKTSQILQAEASKESQVRRAEGEAEAITKVAIAEAGRNDMIYKSLRDANLDEKIIALRSVDAAIEMAKGTNKVFVPYQSSAVLGSIGAIVDLLKGSEK